MDLSDVRLLLDLASRFEREGRVEDALTVYKQALILDITNEVVRKRFKKLTRMCFIRMGSGHLAPVRSVAWSPDGRYVVSGAGDSTIRVWEAVSGKLVRRLEWDDPLGTAHNVAWSPDGRHIISALRCNSIVIWDVVSGLAIKRFGVEYEDCLLCAALSPDGHYVAGSWIEGLRIWDIKNEKLVRELSISPVNDIAWSPDGRYIVASDEELDFISVWDVFAGKRIRNIWANGSRIFRVAWSPDGRYIAGGLENNVVAIFCFGVLEGTTIMKKGEVLACIAWSPDGRYIVGGLTDHTVRIWDAESGKELVILSGHKGDIESVAWSPDGRYIASGSSDCTVRIWDANSGKEIRIFRAHERVEHVAWSPNGRYVASSIMHDGIVIWDVESSEEFARISMDRTPHVVVWSPDGHYIAADHYTAGAYIWEFPTIRLVRVLGFDRNVDGKDRGLIWIAWSPDGRYIAGGFDSGMIRVWDVATGDVVKIFTDRPSSKNYITWSPDGKYLATSSTVRIRVLDVDSGEIVSDFHLGCCVFGIDWFGKVLVASRGDDIIVLYPFD